MVIHPAQAGPLVRILSGDDRSARIVWETHQHAQLTGNNDAAVLLDRLRPAIRMDRIHITPGYFRQKRRWQLNDCDLIWNTISDEVQNPKTLMIAQKIIAAAQLPVVNAPAQIPRTGRVDIARRMQGLDGVIAPKVLGVRNPAEQRLARLVDGAGFNFPAIVRRAGTHNGEVLGIFADLASLSGIFGDTRNEYVMTEYVDVRHRDGFYRKTRFFFVGEQIITRQHIVSDQWSIHGHTSRRVMEEDPGVLDEARDMLVNGFASLPLATRTALHAIRQRAGLDYGGLDCCLTEDGRVILFECNATMNFTPHFRNPVTSFSRASLPRMMAAVASLVHAKTARVPAV